MGHNSENCSDDLDTFWDDFDVATFLSVHSAHLWSTNKSYFRSGYEFCPNCGRYDNGGAAERPCAAQSFNNGSFVKCQPCFHCPPNHQRLSECNATTNTQCFIQSGITESMLTSHQFQIQQVQVSTSNPTTAKHIDPRLHGDSATSHVNHQTCLLSSWFSVLAFLLFIYIKKRRRRSRPFCFRTRHSPVVIFPRVLPGSDLQSAPLQTVLDNLDVLEELVILLDPESPGVKNTSHLASRCSFPATWITYTYSLRESKSPLRAVLEGVTTKHPEWTVGHLARLLREMDRNDTVVVLTKLSLLKVF
uniref:IGF-like family receptor 1 n=1 Tax=Oncorhynchus kisutch TaxID=8019 RepID=A0A8C7EZJ3_ONCKI